MFKEKGWFYQSVVGIFRSLFKDLPTANALDLQPDDTIEITLLTPTTRFPFPSMDNAVTETLASLTLWIVLSILAGLLLLLLIGILIYFFVIPLTQHSSTLRHCVICQKSSDHLTPTTDIFLDIVHIYSGEQIRAYITTITTPSCSLCFTGSVQLNGFWVSTDCLKVTLHIDWHNCLLHYDEFVIPLPEKGTAFAFQPNLLTDFS